MITNKCYCMSSFLALRYVPKDNIAWAEGVLPKFKHRDFSKSDIVYNAIDIDFSIKKQLKNIDLSYINCFIQ